MQCSAPTSLRLRLTESSVFMMCRVVLFRFHYVLFCNPEERPEKRVMLGRSHHKSVCAWVSVQPHLTLCRICAQVSVVAIELFHHGALQACPLSLPVLHQLLPVTGFPFVSPLNLFAHNKGQANKTVTFLPFFTPPCLFQFLSLLYILLTWITHLNRS